MRKIFMPLCVLATMAMTIALPACSGDKAKGEWELVW